MKKYATLAINVITKHQEKHISAVISWIYDLLLINGHPQLILWRGLSNISLQGPLQKIIWKMILGTQPKDNDTYNRSKTFGLLPIQECLYNVGTPSPHLLVGISLQVCSLPGIWSRLQLLQMSQTPRKS